MSKQFKEQLLHIATIGKTVGIHGDMKFHDKSDFPEQFFSGAKFLSKDNSTIILDDVNINKLTVRLQNIYNPQDAKRYINQDLYTTYEATRKNIKLKDGEFFWFDIFGCEVIEDGVKLGIVKDIERIGIVNYLSVTTDNALIEKGENKSFLIPYHAPFLIKTDIDSKIIEVDGCLDILQAS